MSYEERVQEWIERYKRIEYGITGHIPDPEDIAMSLVDEDVANGEYEGCSSELEMAYVEYMAAIERLARRI